MIKYFGRTVAAFTALLAIAACGGEAEKGAAQAAAGKSVEAVPVSVTPVTRIELARPVIGTGGIHAQRTTEVGPRVDGIIQAIHVEVGDRVEAGAPLFTTRRVDYEISRNERKYALDQARAEVKKAERDVKRFAKLRKSDTISENRLADARTDLDIARARRGGAQAALARAQRELADTEVGAPFTGVITRRYVDQGVFMNTRFSSQSAPAVVQIQKIDIVMAILQIPEAHLSRIGKGTKGIIRVDGLDEDFDSYILILNDRVDAASRSVEIRMPIANPDYRVKPGLFARVELLPPPRQAVVVDRRGLLGGITGRYVWIADGGRAARRAVTVRDLDAGRVEVIEGLVPGDRVLAGPSLPRLSDGAAIRIEHSDVAG